MRILFKFAEDNEWDLDLDKHPKLFEMEIWKDDISCTFVKGDMLLHEVFDSTKFKKYRNEKKLLIGDHPIVSCTRFERDKRGVYQVVWISLPYWE
jgi:hypothetical protein